VTPDQLLAEARIKLDLIPSGTVGRRYYRPMQPRYITIHSTQNYTGNAYQHALALEPQLLLMDEPFGALDEITRDRLNEHLLRLWDQMGKTVIFVTHSISEAVYLSSRIVVMSPRPGRILEVIENDLPRDRTLDVRETPGFLEVAHRVRVALRAGHSYDDD
jgi:ABC-type nitrate/sulfonate/bicarbonate transport system ATPase subunit